VSTNRNEREPDLEGLLQQTAAELRIAIGDANEQRQACGRFFRRGRIAGISTGALVDYLGVSSPSILDMAGYPDDAAQEVMVLIGDISDREIEEVAV
jgi:hypothetical protein